jgi:DNA-binding MarR family transcriptional regulator
VQETADAMAREGLVTLVDNPGHKRAWLVSPTPRARKALAQLRPLQVQFANVMASAHPLEALHTTLDVLRESRTTVEDNQRSRPA